MQDAHSQGNFARGALQAIFAVFLGLMIAVVVGVGVYTFYPMPATDLEQQVDQLYEEEFDLECPGDDCEQALTAQERAQLKEVRAEIRALDTQIEEQRSTWFQRTSIILVVVATALMATSLLLGESVAVMSNGILLGGLFTMVYGVGWGLASGSSVTRFLVLVVALAISLVLGYLKFVRGRSAASLPTAATPGAVAPDTGDPITDLANRVTALERRLSAAAELLSAAPAPPRDDERRP